MFTRQRGKDRIEYYSGIEEFIETVNTREYNEHAETKRVYRRSFAGVATYDEARRLLENGYSEPVKAMDGVKVNDDDANRRPRFYNNVVGGAVVVPLALAGVPTCMIDRRPEPRRDKVVRLLVDVGRAGVVSTYEIEEWGKNIVALVRALENDGRRVELNVLGTCTNYNGAPLYAFRFPIKRAREPLDIKRICFPLLHSGFQRVFKFDWFDRLPDSEPVWCYGESLCYHMNEPETQEQYIKPLLEDGEHLINYKTDFDELKTAL